MNIHIFTTNVTIPAEVVAVKPLLTSEPAITDWNFDLEDCDHILRVVSDDNVSPRYIEGLLNKAGFVCEELAY